MAVAAALIIIGIIIGFVGLVIFGYAYEEKDSLYSILIGPALCLVAIAMVLVGANRIDTLEATNNENSAECIEEENE